MHLIEAGVGADTTKPASEKQSAQRLYINLLKLQQHKGSLHKSPLEKQCTSMDEGCDPLRGGGEVIIKGSQVVS